MSTPAPSFLIKAGWLLMAFTITFALIFFASTTLILAVGMLPTLVALVTDQGHGRHASLSISVLNFAGVMPAIFSLWHQGQSFGVAMSILLEPRNWLIMYGGAGIGLALYTILPKMIASFVTMRAESQLESLQQAQKKMVEKWGSNVDILALRKKEKR